MLNQTVSEYLREKGKQVVEREVRKITYKEIFLKYLKMYQKKEKELKLAKTSEQYIELKKDLKSITDMVLAAATEAEKAGEF